MTELAQCLRLRPNDSEAEALLAEWKGLARPQAPELNSNPKSSPNSTPASVTAAEPKADPLERIARNFDAVAFRQAALMLDQVEASRLAALTPRQRAQKLAGQAKDYLNRGLLLEAERLYQSAVATDGKVAEAHEGLAEVRELTGDAEAARKEARAALRLEPSADAYLVLGRLDLAGGHLDDANKEAGEALRLDPTSRAVQELRRQIEARKGQKK
jgi:tetratricopeptide (TPR) repeat protein